MNDTIILESRLQRLDQIFNALDKEWSLRYQRLIDWRNNPTIQEQFNNQIREEEDILNQINRQLEQSDLQLVELKQTIVHEDQSLPNDELINSIRTQKLEADVLKHKLASCFTKNKLRNILSKWSFELNDIEDLTKQEIIEVIITRTEGNDHHLNKLIALCEDEKRQ